MKASPEFSEPREIGGPEEEVVIERARASRARLLSNFLVEGAQGFAKSRSAQKLLNQLPAIGDIIMGVKAIRGREGDRVLSSRERFLHASAFVTTVIGYLLLREGRVPEGGAAHMASEVFTQIDALPVMIREAADKLTNANPRLASVLAASAEFLRSQKENLSGWKEVFGQSLTTLKLNEFPRKE